MTKVIQLQFWVMYRPDHVWYILRDMGWSCQKPERDEEAIERWGEGLKSPWLHYRYHGRKLLHAQAYGPKPIQYSWDSHDLLAIAAITISPQNRHLGLYFEIHDHNILFGDVIAFVTSLHLRRRSILDRYRAHHKAILTGLRWDGFLLTPLISVQRRWSGITQSIVIWPTSSLMM